MALFYSLSLTLTHSQLYHKYFIELNDKRKQFMCIFFKNEMTPGIRKNIKIDACQCERKQT